MKRYTFSNFAVQDGNRAAFETARRIADLEPVAPLPVVFVGDEGSGKTHLLYAIVNRLRASSSKTGLAYVTPQDFPDQVRALVDDPSPVQRAQSAVLLVDQLDGVDHLGDSSDLVEELEAVVRIFLDHGHGVVLASNVHPSRLRKLTDGLHDLILTGQTVTVEAASGENRLDALEQRIRQESAETIERQRQEIENLRAELEAARADSSKRMSNTERADLEQRLEVAKAFGESLQRDLAAARDELNALRQGGNQEATRLDAELNSLRAEFSALREEAKHLHEAQLAARAEADAGREAQQAAEAGKAELELELEQLREELLAAKSGAERLEQLEAELRAAQDDVERLAPFEHEVEKLRNELGTVRQDHSDARKEANRLLSRAEGLLELIESNRAQFTEVENRQRQQIEELEALVAERNAHAISAEDFDAVRGRAEDLERQLEEARSETQGVRDAHDRTKEQLDQAHQHNNRLQEENRGLREELEERSGRVDALQSALEARQANLDDALGDLAAQRAASEVRITALEEQLQELHNELISLRGAASGVAGDLQDFAEEMRNGANELGALVGRLRGITGADLTTAAAKRPPAPPTSWDYARAEDPAELELAPENGNGEHHDESFAEFTFPEAPEAEHGAHSEGDEDPSI